MNIKQILCQKIANHRKQLGLSQAALAERLHISPEAMSRIEKGIMAPKLSRLDSIARNLRCTVPELFRPDCGVNYDRLFMIADVLSGLPEDAQDAIVHLVIETSPVMCGRYSKD